MTVPEFIRWAAFINLEPRGDERRDWHTAMMLQQQADIHRDPKKSSRSPVHKFLPQFKQQRKKSVSDFRELLLANHAALSGTENGT